MTVCVAARSLKDMCVAGACDMMLSTTSNAVPATEDATVKILKLGARWGVMYSGSPTFALDAVSRAEALLRMGPRNAVIAETMAEMRRVMKAAFIAEMKQQVYETILARYGIDHATFIKKWSAEIRGCRVWNYQQGNTRVQSSYLVSGMRSRPSRLSAHFFDS